VNWEMLGQARRVISTKENTTIVEGKEKVRNRRKNWRNQKRK